MLLLKAIASYLKIQCRWISSTVIKSSSDVQWFECQYQNNIRIDNR